MPHPDPPRSEPIAGVVGDVLRYLGWWCVGGLMAVGACGCGGVPAMEAYRDWQRAGPPPRRHRHPEDVVEREAARGVREIEAFLDARPQPRSES